MSRLGAQKTINNFSKGWVTEYSPLNFPENSLTTALNINIKRDGSIESRNTFTKQLATKDISGIQLHSDWDCIKTFHFPNDLGIVIVHLRQDKIKFQFFHEVAKNATQMFLPEDGSSFRDLSSFDVAFLEDGFCFFVNEATNSAPFDRDSQVYRLVIGSDGSIDISTRLREDVTEGSVRVPETGYILSHSNFVPGDDFAGANFSGIRYRQESWFVAGSSDWRLKKADWYIYENGIVIGGPYKGWPEGSTKQVDWMGESRTYNRGINSTTHPTGLGILPLPEVPKPGSNWASGVSNFLISTYYLKGSYGTSLSGQAGKLKYRDTFGMPQILDDITLLHSETMRYSKASPFYHYNLFNSGWRWGAKVKYAGTAKGETIKEIDGSLAYATRLETDFWPSLNDSPDDNKIDKANNVEALGLYSPWLLASEPPLVGRVRRGSNILQLTGEYKGVTNNPHLFSYFTPAYSKSMDEVVAGAEYELIGVTDYDFFTKAREVKNSSGITALTYINGRLWFGVEHQSFNLAFSQVEKPSVKGFDWSPEVGTLVNCYQDSDPNAPEMNDLVATDGGTLSLRNLGTVKKIVEFRNYVLVFSTEGVWALYGANTGASFSPTAFSIDNISKRGITDNQNVVVTGDRVYYVSKDSIYVVTVDEKGLLSVNNIANDTIKTGVRTLVDQFNRVARKVTSISYDYLEKKVYFNYNELKKKDSILGLLSTLQGAADALVANGLTTLVFDETLGCFYKWKASSTNYTSYFFRGAGVIPPVSASTYLKDKGLEEFIPNGETRGSLGFFYTGNYGLFCIYDEFKVRAEEVTDVSLDRYVPYLTGKTFLYGSQLPEQGMYDSLTQSPTYPFDIQFSIPYEIFGEMSVDKSVTTASFYKDSTKATRAGNNLLMTADWDTGGVTNPVNLHGNIRYPLNGSHVPRILTNKIKIPGSGNYLSLSFTNEDKIDEQGFNLLGYGFSVSIENRP